MLHADHIHHAHAENILNYPHSFDHVRLARALNSHLIDHVLVDFTFPLLLLRLICIIHNGFVKFPWLVLWLFTLFIYLTAVHYLQWVDHVPLGRAFNAVKYSHWIDHVPLTRNSADVIYSQCVHYSQ